MTSYARSIPSLDDFIQVASKICHGFSLDGHNEPVFHLLYQYATRDKAFEDNSRFSLSKGILLAGNVGTGKTDMMKSLQRLLIQMQSDLVFKSAVTWAIADEFSKKDGGYAALEKYRTGHRFFDELGLLDKEWASHYQNRVNIAENLILTRYGQFKAGYLTHFTTNLKPKELEEAYDLRTYSRLLEMCNVIPLSGPDRRRTAKPRPVQVTVEQIGPHSHLPGMHPVNLVQIIQPLEDAFAYISETGIYRDFDLTNFYFHALWHLKLISLSEKERAGIRKEEREDLLKSLEKPDYLRSLKKSNLPLLEQLEAFKVNTAAAPLPGNQFEEMLRDRCCKRAMKEFVLQFVADGRSIREEILKSITNIKKK